MKKGTLLIALQLMFIGAFGQSWEIVGNQMFGLAWGELQELELIDDVPHVIYIDYDSWELRLSVYENNAWSVPTNGVIAAEAGGTYRSVVDNNNNLYVAYQDDDFYGDVTVKKWTGTNWQIVGAGGFGIDAVTGYPMQIGVLADNSLVVAYARADTWLNGHGYLDVLRFNGTTWDFIGQNVAGTPIRYITMGILSTDEIYLNYLTEGNDSRISKYNGTSWTELSTVFDSDTCYRTNIYAGANDEIIAWRTNLDSIGTKFFKVSNDVWEMMPDPNQLATQNFDVLYDNWAIEYNEFDNSWYAGFSFGEYYGSFFKKFNGTNWELVGDSIVYNPGGFEYSDLEFNSLGVPFYTSEHRYLMSLTGASTTSIANNDDLSKFSMYPNPSSDFIYVTFIGTATELKIVDLNGKTLFSKIVNSGEQIDISDFKSGIYFLKLNESIQKLIVK